jgi:hypothetical protein
LIEAVDPAGNVDPTAQPIVWTVDSTPPDTTLANPGNVVAKDFVAFTFTSTEAGSTFQCAFGNAPFAACTSPDVVDVPGSGAHAFKVRAIDGAGNIDPTPAVYRWTSDLTPPKRPKVTIFEDPVAGASAFTPVPVATRNPGLGLTFTNPLAKLLSTPTFSSRPGSEPNGRATRPPRRTTSRSIRSRRTRPAWGSTARTSTSTMSTPTPSARRSSFISTPAPRSA